MNQGSLITVVVPVYNVEQYLKECIESLCYQTYKNLEIILVDDGSTDQSGEICDSYQHTDSRIHVIHQKNGGLSDARNTGIEAASGKFITFVDSDDVCDPNMISYLYKLLCSHEADLSVCQRCLIDETSKSKEVRYQSIEDSIILGNHACMKAFLTKPGIDTVAWGKLYKTKLFDSVRYPYGKYNEDVFTTYKVIAKCNCIAVGSKRLYRYRVRHASIMQSSFSEKHLDGIEGACVRADFIKTEYPYLSVYANAKIIYAVNQCALRIARDKKLELSRRKRLTITLQKYYRSYEKDYLRGPGSIAAKLFSIVAFIDLRIAMLIAHK